MTGMTRRDFDDATNTSHVEDLLTKLEFSDLLLNFPQPEMNTIGYCIGRQAPSKQQRGSVLPRRGRDAKLRVSGRAGRIPDDRAERKPRRLPVRCRPDRVRHPKLYRGADRSPAGLTNRIKIWISGYWQGRRRAAIWRQPALNEQFGKENVFAYCLSARRSAVGSDVGGERYGNIFCIVNPIDLVPKAG